MNAYWSHWAHNEFYLFFEAFCRLRTDEEDARRRARISVLPKGHFRGTGYAAECLFSVRIAAIENDFAIGGDTGKV
jgi:hypothetical protein